MGRRGVALCGGLGSDWTRSFFKVKHTHTHTHIDLQAQTNLYQCRSAKWQTASQTQLEKGHLGGGGILGVGVWGVVRCGAVRCLVEWECISAYASLNFRAINV